MKYLVVMVIALVAFVAADEQWSPVRGKEAFRKIYDDCTKESGITPEQDQKIQNLEHPDEKEAREYMRCFVKKLGVFTDDKGYDIDRLMSQIGVAVDVDNVDKTREILAGCFDSNEEKSAPDVWAYRGQKCMMDSVIGKSLIESTKKSHNHIE